MDADLLDGGRIGEKRHPLVTFPIGSDGCIKKNGKRSGEQIGKELNRESSGMGLSHWMVRVWGMGDRGGRSPSRSRGRKRKEKE
jgi:hypothetical protein